MTIIVREMQLDEVDLIIDYFHNSTPQHLEQLGVDPTRLPGKAEWRQRYELDFSQPRDQRKTLLIVWQANGKAVGFSTADKIAYGEQANMHLHIVDPTNRAAGLGEACVRQSVELYFDRLRLERLFCEPNAFNVAPNRTLQKAGFRYVKTHNTVPGPLNFHQAVTRWVIERPGTPK